MADPREELELDENGGVVVRPVIGWTTSTVAGMNVFLRIRFAETPAEVETGGRQLQVILTPRQARDLAAELERQGARIMDNARREARDTPKN